jgi:hypothetical protein
VAVQGAVAGGGGGGGWGPVLQALGLGVGRPPPGGLLQGGGAQHIHQHSLSNNH